MGAVSAAAGVQGEYALEPSPLRSRPLDPSTCESCGSGEPIAAGLCLKCSSGALNTEDVASQDIGAVSSDGPPAGGGDGRRSLFAPGQAFGTRYTIVEQVGSGGMGTVYKARDGETARTVALKLLRPDVVTRVGALSRFKRELALAQTISHPNVYRVHDLGEVQGTAFISMEFIEGQSLDDLIHSMGHLSPRQTVAIGRQICGGLQAIHEKAIVHRDLKPSNIMVDLNGVARLMDFGLAYQTGSEHLTSEGQVLGTMAYLSPEQARGETLGAASDVFAMGLILYEMLTGKRPPGDGKPIPLALRGIIEPCPKPSLFVPEIPKALDAIVMRCLDREPAKRFQSAEALGAALAAVAAGQTTRISLGALRRASRPYQTSQRRRWPWLVASALLLATLFAVPAVRGKVAGVFGRHAAPPVGVEVVGVLPLRVAAGDADGQDLAVGIADMLATDLDEAGCGSVLPRTALTHLGTEDVDVRKVAADLGLTRVVTGTVSGTPAAMRMEINTFAADGSLGPGYEADGDALALQRKVADRLVAITCVGGSTRAARAPTSSAPAFLAYAKGLRLLDRRDLPGNATLAVTSLEEATRLDANFALAHAVLGSAYMRRYEETREAGYTRSALSEISKALILDAAQPRVRLIYADVQRSVGEGKAARDEIEKLITDHPENDEARALYSTLLAQDGETARALETAQAAVARRPKYFQNRAALGYAHAMRGDLQGCIDAYTAATSLQPDYADGFIMMGACAQNAGDNRGALGYYEKARAMVSDATLESNIGTVLYDQGEFRQAAAAYERAAKLMPGEMLFWWNLGDAHERLGDREAARAGWNRAVSVARQALSVDGENVLTRARLGLCEAKLGMLAEARRDTDQAVQLAPQRGEILALQAAALALAGQHQESLAALRKALANGYSRERAAIDHDLRSLRKLPEWAELVSAAQTTPASGPGGTR